MRVLSLCFVTCIFCSICAQAAQRAGEAENVKGLSKLPAEAQSAVWTQLAELTESDGSGSDQLGYSVAMSGNTIAVGSPYASIGSNVHQGAIYVFTKPASGWTNMTQTAKLTASDGVQWETLGFSVAFSGNTIVAGTQAAGRVYIFVQPAGGWVDGTETAELSGFGDDYFGSSVAIAGNTIVAAEGEGIAKGAALVFVKPSGGWQSTSTYNAALTASDGLANDELGYSVSISGNTIVVGAPGCNTFQGAAYIFVKPAGGWADTTQIAKLTASDGSIYDDFGDSVAISGATIAVGAPNAVTGTTVGKAYVFVEPSGGWANATQTAELYPSDSRQNLYFGWSAAVLGNIVTMGALNGNTYGFRKPATGWTDMTESVELTEQGSAVAIAPGVIVAGSRDYPGNGVGYEGAAFVFGP
jgi:hypothetical protein